MAASRILVAFDESPHAYDALALARTLATATGAEIVLGRVVPWEPLALSVTPIPQVRTHFEEQERLTAEKLQRVSDREGVAAEAMPGVPVGEGLHDLAEELNPELVVVGSSHRSAIGQVLAGNVGLRLLNGLDRPLAVPPAGYSEGARRLETIGVGFDGSPESRAALQAAMGLARASDAEVKIIGVAPPYAELTPSPWAFGWGAGALRTDLEERLRGRVESAARELPREVRHSLQSQVGNPTEVLLDASRELDLLVVGSRGYGPARRLLLGSVSARIVREARCPVLVAPRPAAPREEAVPAQAAQA
jgi:nucleotide-binding universal stress UspA family protein